MESAESIPEETTVSPAKEVPTIPEETGDEPNGGGSDTGAEINGTENGNGHDEPLERVEDLMDTSEPPLVSGSTETSPVKTKAAMKDISGIGNPSLADESSEEAPVTSKEEEKVAEPEKMEESEKLDSTEEKMEKQEEILQEEMEEKTEDKTKDKSEDRTEEKTEETKEEKMEEKTEEETEEKIEETTEEKMGEKTEVKNEELDAFDAMVSGKPVENEKPKDSSDSVLEEEKKEEPKDAFNSILNEKKDEKPKDAFDSILDEKKDEKPKDPSDSMLEENKSEEPEKKEVDDVSSIDAKNGEEVVTVEDDGKPFEPEEAWLKGMPGDEEYFKSLNQEELDWYKENGPKVETAGESGLKCTSCFKNVTIIVDSHNGVTRHFKLGVAICKGCKYFYKDGSGWEQDDEGLDKYCRWCGQGGEILICDKCPSAFCRRCLQRNLGRSKLAEITNGEEWKCLICDPKQIYEQRAFYHAIYQRYKSGNFKKPDIRKTPRTPAKPKPEPVGKEEVEAIMKSPRNFVDENIFEAFKTLSVYQKCLEQERDRWIKSSKSMNVDSAVSTCRALRKIYAITKQNMDLLDKAIVQSFVEKYPKDSVKIHMGKVGVKVKEGALTGKPVSVKTHTRVKLKAPKAAPKKKKAASPKRKTLPKKKAVTPKKGKTQEVVIMNGSPVYADPDDHDIFQVVRPTLSKKKAGPASKTNKKQLYTKKRATRYSSDNDSDVVTLSSDDEKPSKPGPASRKRKTAATPIASPPKKRRPGPKSKTY